MEKEVISKEKFTELVRQWLKYAETEFYDEYLERLTSGVNFKAMKDQGYATDESISSGMETMRPLLERTIADEQSKLIGQNIERVKTLAKISVGGIKNLRGKTVISIGGGPGDKICEPWFPRMAGFTGAKTVNFDVSAEHAIDAPLGLYTHIGGFRGDIFSLLINDETIYDELEGYDDIMIIECDNLLGKNPSPDLAISLSQLGDLDNNPIFIQLRKNLFLAAKKLLAEGGVLAIDDYYWIKKEGNLQPIDDKGNEREEIVFAEEDVLT